MSRCFPSWCMGQEKNSKSDLDLDGFMRFMQGTKHPSTNPGLRDMDVEGLTAVDHHTGSSSALKGKKDNSRQSFSSMHVIEDIYYLSVGTPRGKAQWREYDPAAFKPVKLNLARGTCSKIHLLQHTASGFIGVMKVMPPNRLFLARAELNVLAECSDCPFIIQVIDAFELEKTSHIFLEYAPFRSLDDLAQLTDGIGSDKSMLFALEILLAIQYLHSRRILHRDIKPENVLLLISGHVKLADFSSATFVDARTNKVKGLCCTYVTRPPEVWDYDYYSYPVDVWAFGISMYNIMSNSWPIVHASQEKQKAHVRRGDINFGSKFSTMAADFILRAVQPKPEDRWTVTQLISHSYFHGLRDPFPAPFPPSELLEMYSFHGNMMEDLPFIQDLVAHLP